MKLSKEHYELLEQAISKLDTPELRDKYIASDFAHSERVKDLDKRYRWDLYWEARRNNPGHRGFGDIDCGLYNDSHIDTALRKIVPTLNKELV
ncbi:MAG TPA: hypothetical protein VLG09_02560 [Candidatus Saccharimonadales bacterium]|nr:hypothetical protein [Candidatus Saccharimonadales bacterium]